MQKIPLSNSPNHTFSVTLSINGSNVVFEFFLSYNEVGEYWTLRIKDGATGTTILDSIPLLTDEYPDANFLSQYDYLKIGNAYVVRAAPADTDFPDDTNLGSLFLLVWGDNTEYYEASSVAEAVAIIESLREEGSAYGIINVKGDTGAPGVSIKGDTGDQGIQGIQGIQGPSGTLPIATAGGTADVITADFDPDIALTNLMLCAFVASAANATTTPTFSPDGLTARVITKQGGEPLAVGDIPGALAVCVLEYNLANTRWELLNPAVTTELLSFSRGGTLVNTVDFLAAINTVVWYATCACTVTNVRGYRVGGTGATVNARRNGADNHLASAVSLTNADTWYDGGAVQNTAYVAGDKLEIMIVGVTGDITQIAIQVDFVQV